VVLLTLGAGAVLALLFGAAFTARGPDEHALLAENLAKFAGDSESAPFFQLVAGLDRPLRNLLRSLESLGQLGLILLLASFGGFAPRVLKRRRHITATFSALALVACACLIWTWAGPRLLQATPFLALAAVGYFLVRDRRDPLLLLALFSLLAGLRVLLQFHPLWYGFYLLVPAYLFVVYALGTRVIEWLPRRRTAIAALVALALLVLGRFEGAMLRAYGDKTSVLVTSKGALRDYPSGRPEAIAEFLEYAETHLAPEEPAMVVMPEGVSLNYFTGFPNPTAYYLFTPPEINSAAVERRMIQELDTTKPEYLLMTSRDLSEFGRTGIGLDYALELGDWIRRSYDLERVFEAGEARPWRLLLLRKRGHNAQPTPKG
jgi:hypothetical protein